MSDRPLQPVSIDAQGIIRFEANAIVRHLYEFARARGCGMNELAVLDFSVEDREQFSQLIGYSLCGFAELDYVRDATYEAAEKTAPTP